MVVDFEKVEVQEGRQGARLLPQEGSLSRHRAVEGGVAEGVVPDQDAGRVPDARPGLVQDVMNVRRNARQAFPHPRLAQLVDRPSAVEEDNEHRCEGQRSERS